MKNKLALIFAAALAVLLFTAQSSPGGWTQGPTHLWRFQSDQTWDSAEATITASPVTAFFCSDLTNGSQVVKNDAGSVTFDPVAIAKTQSVTAAGTTVTYDVLAALNAQAALDQYNKQAKKP